VPTVTAPAAASIGSRISIVASGLRPAKYAMTLSLNVSERNTACVAQISGDARPSGPKMQIKLAGKIPKRLSCYSEPNEFLGNDRLSPGTYHLIVGAPIAPAGWSSTASFVRVVVKITP
jgi:hypothetical protein